MDGCCLDCEDGYEGCWCDWCICKECEHYEIDEYLDSTTKGHCVLAIKLKEKRTEEFMERARIAKINERERLKREYNEKKFKDFFIMQRYKKNRKARRH